MKTNDNDEGVLAIFYSKDENGRTNYRAGGRGPVYSKFYAFLRGISYVSVDDDISWDYFYISDHGDEVVLISKFGKYMSEDVK